MDRHQHEGKDAGQRNVLVAKYEKLYVRAYSSMSEARASIDLTSAVAVGPSLGCTTPNRPYFTSRPLRMAA